MNPRKSLLVCALLIAGSAFAGTFPADDKAIRYSGRVDFSNKKAPRITWPATYIETKFTGTSLKVTLIDEKGKNHFGVYIDGNYEKPHIIKCKEGKHTYDVATGLADETHRLLIYKRTEGGQGHTLFNGLTLDSGAKLIELDARPELRMEVFGDSISCGLGNEAGNKKQEHNGAFENSFLAYGAITARNLRAEYRCTSKSGIGLIKSWFPTTMPQYYNRLLATDGPSRPWDFRKWQPQIVVVNLFQNDSWLIKGKPGDNDCIKAYVTFIRTLRKHYPKADIFCTLGSMSASTTKWAGFVKSAVKAINGAGDRKVHAYIFKTRSGDMHPKVQHHRKMAEELTGVIKAACKLK